MDSPANQAGNITTGTQRQGAVLTRYHSAPSSVLTGLLHLEELVEDSELARVCMSTLRNVQNAAENPHGCMRAYNPHVSHALSSTIPQAAIAAESPSFPQQCIDRNESLTTGHLCSIFKHTQNDPCANLRSSAQNTEHSTNSELSSAMPNSLPSLTQAPFLSTKSNLIRHSSFPAEILSRLGVEESKEVSVQQFAGPYMRHNSLSSRDMHTAAESMPYDKVRGTHVEAAISTDNMRLAHIPHDSTRDAHASHHNTTSTQFPLTSTGWLESARPHLATKGSSFNGKGTMFQVKEEMKVSGAESMESSLSANQSSLFRQSSLPASLLSQLSFSSTCERVSMPSSSGNSSEEDKRVGGSCFSGRVSGFWDDAGAGSVALGPRKRGRGVEDKAADGLSVLDSFQRGCVEEELLQWNFGGQSDMSSGSLLGLDDSVLCKVRAKRGCATHPRSIAERVRRTKISEGMRKLQELVPNMDKQTNTATMLDEAVEYVKFLQQQVQKLSESQAKCNGRCHSKRSV